MNGSDIMEKMVVFESDDFVFEVVDEKHLMADYTADCSNGGRSCCCTRSCTQNGINATEEEWGEFLEVNSGIIQY